jgi:RHS repeat-associated protein
MQDLTTTLASNIDGTVRRLTAAYGVHGLTKLASWNNAAVGSGSVVNEVELVYNNFGQIVQDRQAHDGVAGSGSPRVEYEYENGSANHVRLKKMVYPTNTSFVEPLYGDALGQDDVLSRVKELRFTKSGTPVTAAEYTYLGMDHPVVVDYLEPKVRLNTASGSGNYPYAGLDRFDRFLQALWQYYGSPSGDREKVVYGYDRSGNRLTRDNQLSGSGGQDEKYAYDGLWQVGTLDRGTLSGGNIGSKVFGQGWTYDQTGNWANFKQDNNGNGTWDLNQNRSHNTANEITSIQVWGAVAHDAMGNMTRIPKPSALASRYACVWDAWNRLVEVKETDGSGNPTTTVATYRYDGFWRRIRKVIGASTRDYYYSLGWQVLEERVGGSLDRQFVWGIRHIDDLVLRDRGSERLYAVHDAMHVTAVVNASGAVQERYGYDGFGRPRVMTAAFAPQDPSTRDWETLFGGYRFDRETGLYQVRFRYLHAELGRFLSRDVVEYFAGTNLLSYVQNRPAWRRDSFGLAPNEEQCEAFYTDLDDALNALDGCRTLEGLGDALRDAMLADITDRYRRLYIKCKEAKCPKCDPDDREGDEERPTEPVGDPVANYNRLMDELRKLQEERDRQRDWTRFIPGTPAQLETAGAIASYIGIGASIAAGGGIIVGGARVAGRWVLRFSLRRSLPVAVGA